MNFNRLIPLQLIAYLLFIEDGGTGDFWMFLKTKKIIYKNLISLNILLYFLLGFSITACQTNNSLSLEEAKEVSAIFEDLSLRIPARTIQDVEMDRANVTDELSHHVSRSLEVENKREQLEEMIRKLQQENLQLKSKIKSL